MRIMGIDPGTARAGWAIVDTNGSQLVTQSYGCITTTPTDTPAKRLLEIYETLQSLLRTYRPDCLAIEDLFYATNAKTVIPVGEARGVAMLAAAYYGIPVVSYTPLAIKRAVCGDGAADKKQVQRMVMRLLKLAQIPKPDDAADALATALTHAYSYKLKGKLA